jgi:hypothetical protein
VLRGTLNFAGVRPRPPHTHMPLVEKAPRYTCDDAVRLARTLYGIDATADALPSERDQNFHLFDGAGAQFVLKIANAEEA